MTRSYPKGNHEPPTKRLVKFRNDFGKIAGYKINTQKSITFAPMNNAIAEKEHLRLASFAAVTKTF